MRVAFQGEPGAYSEEAILRLEGPEVERVPQRSFKTVFEAVVNREVSCGIIPIENSIVGPVIENHDLLLDFPLSITGEVVVRVRHCLLAKLGEPLAELKTVHSHPQALAQCAKFIEGHRLLAVPEYDTAGSAKLLSQDSLPPRAAAVASRAAAEIYGLRILAEGIEDRANYTRFYRLNCEPVPGEPGNRTAIAFAVPNVPGALSQALGVFALRNINVDRLHSRPNKIQPWEYLFFLEFEGTPANPECAHALDELRKIATLLRNLGSFLGSPLPEESN